MAEIENVPRDKWRVMTDAEKAQFYKERADYYFDLWQQDKRGGCKSACIGCIRRYYYYYFRSEGVFDRSRGVKQYERSWYRDYLTSVAPYALQLIETAKKMRDVCVDEGFSYTPPTFLNWAMDIQIKREIFEKFPPL